jgi:hypothetical protein
MKKTNYENRVAFATGWGLLSFNSSSKVNVPLTNSACTTKTLYKRKQITKNMICAMRPGKGACQGKTMLFEHFYFYSDLRGFWWAFASKRKTQLFLPGMGGVLGLWVCPV